MAALRSHLNLPSLPLRRTRIVGTKLVMPLSSSSLCATSSRWYVTRSTYHSHCFVILSFSINMCGFYRCVTKRTCIPWGHWNGCNILCFNELYLYHPCVFLLFWNISSEEMLLDIKQLKFNTFTLTHKNIMKFFQYI